MSTLTEEVVTNSITVGFTSTGLAILPVTEKLMRSDVVVEGKKVLMHSMMAGVNKKHNSSRKFSTVMMDWIVTFHSSWG